MLPGTPHCPVACEATVEWTWGPCSASCGPEGSTVNQDVAVTSYPANVSHYCERFQEFNKINPSGDVSMRNG